LTKKSLASLADFKRFIDYSGKSYFFSGHPVISHRKLFKFLRQSTTLVGLALRSNIASRNFEMPRKFCVVCSYHTNCMCSCSSS